MNPNVIFVSRHAGAIEWVQDQGLKITDYMNHLPDDYGFQAGDAVVGSLPISIVAQLNRQGVRYFHINLSLTAAMRGKELTKQDMVTCHATLEEFIVTQPRSVLG